MIVRDRAGAGGVAEAEQRRKRLPVQIRDAERLDVRDVALAVEAIDLDRHEERRRQRDAHALAGRPGRDVWYVEAERQRRAGRIAVAAQVRVVHLLRAADCDRVGQEPRAAVVALESRRLRVVAVLVEPQPDVTGRDARRAAVLCVPEGRADRARDRRRRLRPVEEEEREAVGTGAAPREVIEDRDEAGAAGDRAVEDDEAVRVGRRRREAQDAAADRIDRVGRARRNRAGNGRRFAAGGQTRVAAEDPLPRDGRRVRERFARQVLLGSHRRARAGKPQENRG